MTALPAAEGTDARGYLLRQLETAWKLAQHHLDGLTTGECLWRTSSRGLHVWRVPHAGWVADWPDREGYDVGPASIALRGKLERLADPDLRASSRTRWPFRDRPFGDAIAWGNVELVKNASEIGYARFLYAARDG